MSTENLKVFSERLKLRRKQQGFTSLSEFADALGVGTSTVHGWEQCKNWPRREVMEKIAELLQTDTDWLEGKTNADPLVLRDTPSESFADRLVTLARPAAKFAGMVPVDFIEALVVDCAHAYAAELRRRALGPASSLGDVGDDPDALQHEIVKQTGSLKIPAGPSPSSPSTESRPESPDHSSSEPSAKSKKI